MGERPPAAASDTAPRRALALRPASATSAPLALAAPLSPSSALDTLLPCPLASTPTSMAEARPLGGRSG